MSRQKTILLVEDNEKIMEANRRDLTDAGYHIEMAFDLAEARACLARNEPDVIVLDILLPDGNGLDFIGEIRGTTTAPVLLLTAMDEKDDILAGLRAGGDDYITKPYDLDVLRARVAAFLRRDELLRNHTSSTTIRGPFVLDSIAQRAYLNGEDLFLQPREYSMLSYLIQHEGTYTSTDSLYEMIWKLPMLENTSAIKTVVSRLRQKITDSGYTIFFLKGAGYCFDKDDQ